MCIGEKMERKILHIDVNNAFLSWTAVDMLEQGSKIDIRNIPSVIGGDEETRRGIVLAKSNLAKKYGIVTGETLYSARKKCPNLKVFKGSSYRYYEFSNKLYNLLLEYTDKIERFSVDECFLDMTEYLMGRDIMCIAKEINKRVYEELKFTVNIGISENKLLAKMASDFEKPNKIHTLYRNEIQTKMWNLPIGELFMLGRKTVPKLNRLGIYKIGDLAKRDKEFMLRGFGKHGIQMWEYANGIDDSEIVYEKVLPKGIGHSITLPKDTSNLEDLNKVLLSLVEKTTYRLRKYNLYATVVTVQIRTKEFENFTHQVKLDKPTNVTKEIYDVAKKLLKDSYKQRELRLIGVSANGLVESDTISQTNIFDILEKSESKHQKYTKVDNAIDMLKNKYGDDIVKFAGRMNVDEMGNILEK